MSQGANFIIESFAILILDGMDLPEDRIGGESGRFRVHQGGKRDGKRGQTLMSVVVDPRGDTVEPMGQAEYCCFLRLLEALAETSEDQNFSLASG